MSKGNDSKDFFQTSNEMKFDSRLLDKKVEHGFLTRSDRDAYLKALPEETEFEFTSMDAIQAEDPTANNG